MFVQGKNLQIVKIFSQFVLQIKLNPYFCNRNEGEMAEWSNAAVLKTVDLHGSGGSNPSLSAKRLS